MKDNETKKAKRNGWGGNVTRKAVKGKGFPYDYSDSHSSNEDDAGTCGSVKVPKKK